MHKYINGRVYTQSGIKEAFAVDNGCFIEVGCNEDIEEYTGETTDLNGAFVCAGFNDSHMHLLNFGRCLMAADLSLCTGSMEEMLEGLKKYKDSHTFEENEWIIGRGYNQDYFLKEKRFPDRYDLDKVSLQRPIAVIRACGHICSVNSKALEIMGINKGSKQIPGGRFDLDKKGIPNGIFRENALELVNAAMPAYTLSQVKQMLLLAQQYVNEQGITSVSTDDFLSLSAVDYHMVMKAYEELEQEKKLTLRVNEQCQFTGTEQLKQFIKEESNREHKGYLYKNGPLKIIGDGSLGARTAFLNEPYEGTDNAYGIEVCRHSEMLELMRTAHQAGMQIAVHAIGDAMMQSVLEAYNEILNEKPVQDHRHGVVHCQIMNSGQYEMFKKLKLHAYIQTVFLDYDTKIVEQTVGRKRAESSYCFKTLLRGASVSNGSDAPVEKPVVMNGIQCAVTRKSLDGTLGPYNTDQAFSISEALDSYTIGGAYADFEENLKGDIREGMVADFAVLDRDPFLTDSRCVKDIKVLKTYFQGSKIYESEKTERG